MSKPFNIHDWQDKQKQQRLNPDKQKQQRLNEQRPPQQKAPRNEPGRFSPGADVPFGGGNPKLEEWKEIDDMFEEVNRAAQGWLEKWINEDHIAKALEDYNQGWNNFEDNTLSTLNFISTSSPAEDMAEHHGDEDFPGKGLSAWDLLDKIKVSDKELYDRVESFMTSMNEMNTTGTGASFNAGAGEGYMTPNAFKKKNKED